MTVRKAELAIIASAVEKRTAYANMLKWQLVQEILNGDWHSGSMDNVVAGESVAPPPPPVRHPAPQNRAAKRAAKRRQGGFKKGRVG